MADTYKVLYINDVGNTTAASLYSPGVNKWAIIKNIKLYNHGANTEIVTFWLNGVTANCQWGVALTLKPSGTDRCSAEWDGTLALANADAIYANTTDSTAVVLVINGDEIS